MAKKHETVRLRLDRLGGPEVDVFSLEPHKLAIIGRALECEVCLPDSSVSRRHAAISQRAGGWFVTDLASRFGTFLNGTRLKPERATRLHARDLLRVGPFTFRISWGRRGSQTVSVDDAPEHGTIVEPVSNRELDTLTSRRLALMIEGSAAIQQAGSEKELAAAVLDLVLAGTGYPRAALLRYLDLVEKVEIVASRDQVRGAPGGGFRFSRSLLQATADGQIARLAPVVADADYGPSIAQLAITTAVCAPLIIDSAVVGAIYVDARIDEPQGYPDAAGFCHAVSRMTSVALSSLKRAELEARQRELDADLEIAQQAQAFLYPSAQGVIGRLKYVVQARPGHVVAGDLFDIFAIKGNKAAICFGDVTGHGMGSALLMTAILSHLRASLTLHGDPAAAVARVNAYIAERSAGNMFSSLWVGVFDAQTAELDYVDAGHGHWMLKRRDGPPSPPKERGGLLIGIEPDFRYEARRIQLAEGDRIVLYSDGLIERVNGSGDEFGAQRLIDVVAESTSVQSDVTEAFAAFEQFTAGAGVTDDTTLASIGVLAACEASSGATEAPLAEVDRPRKGARSALGSK